MAEIPREDGEAPIQMQSEVAGAGEASFSSNTDSTKQFLDFFLAFRRGRLQQLHRQCRGLLRIILGRRLSDGEEEVVTVADAP